MEMTRKLIISAATLTTLLAGGGVAVRIVQR
jgi:hypothetical protein